MAIDYDASDDPPASLQQMLTYKSSVQTNAWKPVSHNSSSSDLNKAKSHYVLTGVPPPNTDIKTYDIGNFYLAVNCIAASGAIGQLFIDYDLVLDTPQTELDPPSVGARGQIDNSAPTGLQLLPTAVTGLLGPLAAFWEESDTPNIYNLYISTPGFYVMTVIFNTDGDSAVYNVALTSEQGPTLLNYFSASGPTYTQTIQFQVVNPDLPALNWNIDAVSTTDYYLYDWNIIPLASSLATTGGYVPLPSLNDPRRRFGRTPKP